MKKYYIHNGIEQKGPFDINDLKSNNISKDTKIWNEGISDWTSAINIDELKGLFKSSFPPPFSRLIPPPIYQSTPEKQMSTNPKFVEKNTKTGWIIFIILLVIFIFGALVIITNNSNSIPGIKLEINTPKPVIITSRVDDKKSKLLKLRTTIYATVQNQGGDGNVLLTFHLYQDGNDYTKIKSIYLRTNESQELEETFDEVTRLGGDITYDVDVETR